ncbi:hypothetical protein P5673_029025 [Acropora cervicornis]|uniref:DEAD/DEAH-box helicase domain-containing protein n=1 Tax=Acropora cervicornis TaxID=6130 RepID=A0AAD9UUQ1_ACRCE|nr:hypothetical protein P5673_029025 [Acropora cervicornis]
MEGKGRGGRELLFYKTTGMKGHVQYYQCKRGGVFKPKGTGKRHLKSQGTLRQEQKSSVKKLFTGGDLLAVLPTGFGKSLIFQLLALVNDDHVVLVICPLKSIVHARYSTTVQQPSKQELLKMAKLLMTYALPIMATRKTCNIHGCQNRKRRKWLHYCSKVFLRTKYSRGHKRAWDTRGGI